MDETILVAALSVVTCVECGRPWELPTERWRLKVLFDERPALTALYCPACHSDEFGRVE